MGNQHTSFVNRSHFLRSKQRYSPRSQRKLCIYRVLGYFPDTSPDVDSLGFPFSVCKRIFLDLSLADLGSCMLVCKEWRSLIDTCDFWRAYARRNYGNGLKEPRQSSALYWWKYHQAGDVTSRGAAAVADVVDADDAPYVFRPFPDLWRCDVVVPAGTEPPTGSVDVHRDYIRAVEALRRIHRKLVGSGLGDIVHVCLLRWPDVRLKPTPADVMDSFGAHALLRRDAEQCAGGAPSAAAGGAPSAAVDDEARLAQPHGVDGRGWALFVGVFSKCFQLGTREWIVAFHCSHELLEPAPAFVLTPLSQGWVGGLLYAV